MYLLNIDNDYNYAVIAVIVDWFNFVMCKESANSLIFSDKSFLCNEEFIVRKREYPLISGFDCNWIPSEK